MITSQNRRGGKKRFAIDNDKVSKKAIKKA